MLSNTLQFFTVFILTLGFCSCGHEEGQHVNTGKGNLPNPNSYGALRSLEHEVIASLSVELIPVTVVREVRELYQRSHFFAEDSSQMLTFFVNDFQFRIGKRNLETLIDKGANPAILSLLTKGATINFLPHVKSSSELQAIQYYPTTSREMAMLVGALSFSHLSFSCRNKKVVFVAQFYRRLWPSQLCTYAVEASHINSKWTITRLDTFENLSIGLY